MTVAAETLLEGEAEAITRKAIELAKEVGSSQRQRRRRERPLGANHRPRRETAEAAQERHFLEHPEDCGANVILRIIV